MQEKHLVTSRSRSRHPLPCIALLSAAVLLSGCGGDDPFSYVKVSGKVTYEDGSLIVAERVSLRFLPQAGPLDEKTHPRPGGAEVNVADGTFDTVTSHKYGDGLVPGKHKVLVFAYDKLERPSAAVPPEYRDEGRTPLEVDTADSPFDLKVRKPK